MFFLKYPIVFHTNVVKNSPYSSDAEKRTTVGQNVSLIYFYSERRLQDFLCLHLNVKEITSTVLNRLKIGSIAGSDNPSNSLLWKSFLKKYLR